MVDIASSTRIKVLTDMLRDCQEYIEDEGGDMNFLERLDAVLEDDDDALYETIDEDSSDVRSELDD